MPSPADMRERFKRIVWRYRSVPGLYGLRTHSVQLVITAWAGAQTGEAAKTATTINLLESSGQNPKVSWVDSEEIALGGLDANTVIIGPITPDFSGGGTALSVLTGAATPNAATFHLLITGPQYPTGTKFKVIKTDGDSALHYTITASPVT